MKLNFTLLAALVSAAIAAPTTPRRQNTCPLQNLSGFTVSRSADSTVKTPVELFTSPPDIRRAEDLGWFALNGQLNGGEVLTATVGSQPDVFTFQPKAAQEVGASAAGAGSEVLDASTAATFQVTCAQCDVFAGGNGPAANGCTMQSVDDGGNGLGQCVTFADANTVVQVEPCDGSAGQSLDIFSA